MKEPSEDLYSSDGSGRAPLPETLPPYAGHADPNISTYIGVSQQGLSDPG
jgi:hypothetical protein